MRILLVGATAMALFGPTASAAADSCVCLGADGAQPLALGAVTVAPSLDDAPVSEPTLGEDALSRPVDELSSAPTLVVLGADAAPSPEPLLWCEGSNDPRCERGTGTPIGPELSSPPPAATPIAEIAVRPRAGTDFPFVHEGLGAARGARRPIDRPPAR